MKDKNCRDRGKRGEYEHPEREPRGWGRSWRSINWDEPIRYRIDKETGKKIYWEKYGKRHIRILHTGQITRKDKAQKFIDRIRDQAFIEGI